MIKCIEELTNILGQFKNCTSAVPKGLLTEYNLPRFAKAMIVPNRYHNSGKKSKPTHRPVAKRQAKARLQALKRKLGVVK